MIDDDSKYVYQRVKYFSAVSSDEVPTTEGHNLRRHNEDKRKTETYRKVFHFMP